jgi:hypothetical protein
MNASSYLSLVFLQAALISTPLTASAQQKEAGQTPRIPPNRPSDVEAATSPVAPPGKLRRDALLPGNPPGAYIIAPAGVETGDLPLRKGCWAKLYDEDGLIGDAITLYGPLSIPNVGDTGVFGIDWKDRIGSISTGPAARLLIYDNPDFTDLVSTIKPGKKERKISKELGFFDQIASLEVLCDKK